MQTGISKQGDYAEYSSHAGIDKTVQNNLIIPINGPASLYMLLKVQLVILGYIRYLRFNWYFETKRYLLL